MAWRYRRRLRLARGLYLNLGKTGATSISLGTRGAHLTLGRRGRRATVGLPGSGLSYTEYQRYGHGAPAGPVQLHHPLIWILVVILVVILLRAAG
jgi:hypothetical protein